MMYYYGVPVRRWRHQHAAELAPNRRRSPVNSQARAPAAVPRVCLPLGGDMAPFHAG